MYYPYLRGKQYELILLRENAARVRESIVPIIEPVKQAMQGLQRALEALVANECRFIVVANPRCGELADDAQALLDELRRPYLASDPRWRVGCIMDGQTTAEETQAILELNRETVVIHTGQGNHGGLLDCLMRDADVRCHVFIEAGTGRLYRHRFAEGERVLVRDGFIVRPNREHKLKPSEHFSDLHITYPDEGMNGFGDYLIVGSEFTEAGGPAHAVAIHLTYLQPDEDDDMYVRHYISDRETSPTDPAGKFAEALAKLVADVGTAGSLILRTDAVAEFAQLHERGHYPGLGYVKKLSMQHHLELLSQFLSRGN